MSKHDDSVRLRHMRDAAEEAISFTRDRVRENLETDRMLSLSLSMLIGIIGEAASRISAEKRDSIPLPWSDIIGMRHRIIHAYDRVNFDTLWKTITEDFPPLIAALEKAIPKDRENAPTTVPGYVNGNQQRNLRKTNPPLPGNDHMQVTYVLECLKCGNAYGANGSDIWLRKCPKCQGGMPGLPIN